MRIEYNHNTPADQVYDKVNGLLAGLQRQHADKVKDAVTNWDAQHTVMRYNMRIMGFKTEGTVTLTDGRVVLDGTVPWLAKPFSGQIEAMVRAEMVRLLG